EGTRSEPFFGPSKLTFPQEDVALAKSVGWQAHLFSLLTFGRRPSLGPHLMSWTSKFQRKKMPSGSVTICFSSTLKRIRLTRLDPSGTTSSLHRLTYATIVAPLASF